MKTAGDIEKTIAEAARDPQLFFGNAPEKVLKEWLTILHPDRWLGLDEARAKVWFTTMTELAEQSKIREKIGSYRVVRRLPDGDLCQITVCGKADKLYLAKRPLVKAAGVLKREVNNLALVTAKANEVAKHLFPKFVENVDGANVFVYGEDLESLLSLSQRYPEGLHGRHLGWIGKRILLALTWAHAAGVVHGAVTPEHILVCKRNHGIVLCDWIFSGKAGDPIKFAPTKYKHLYPSFVIADKRLSYKLDIAMAGRCLSSVMGDNVHQRLRNFILAMASGIMGEDAHGIHGDFDALLRRVFGSPKWFELE